MPRITCTEAPAEPRLYLDGQQAVLYRSRMNPSLGRNSEALDPLEWLARVRRSHPRARHHSHVERLESPAAPPRRRSSPTRARLIAKAYLADPLVWSRYSRKMQVIAFLTDQLAIQRVLDHLGLELPQEKPPPLRELTVVPVDEQGELPVGWALPNPAAIRPPSARGPPRSVRPVTKPHLWRRSGSHWPRRRAPEAPPTRSADFTRLPKTPARATP